MLQNTLDQTSTLEAEQQGDPPGEPPQQEREYKTTEDRSPTT